MRHLPDEYIMQLLHRCNLCCLIKTSHMQQYLQKRLLQCTQILTAVSIGSLQTSEIDNVFNRLLLPSFEMLFGAGLEPRFCYLVLA